MSDQRVCPALIVANLYKIYFSLVLVRDFTDNSQCLKSLYVEAVKIKMMNFEEIIKNLPQTFLISAINADSWRFLVAHIAIALKFTTFDP